MRYCVKRLLSEDDTLVGYQLFSDSAKLLLVADVARYPEDASRRRVRFVRPDGTLLATMELPPEGEDTQVELNPDYAIIQDYAVYAIVSRRRFTADDEADAAKVGRAAFYTLETEGDSWLVLPATEAGNEFFLYGRFMDSVRAYDDLLENNLPPQIGHIYPVEGEEHYLEVELTTRRWRQTTLVVLALTFLLESLS